MATSDKKHSFRVKAGVPFLEAEYKTEWNSATTSKELIIISPADKDIIQAERTETHHLKRPITGKISGFKREEINKLQLSIEISIYTDTWYPQGTTLVNENAQWTFENACFAGVTHIIRAILRDKDHRQYATVDHVITVQH